MKCKVCVAGEFPDVGFFAATTVAEEKERALVVGGPTTVNVSGARVKAGEVESEQILVIASRGLIRVEARTDPLRSRTICDHWPCDDWKNGGIVDDRVRQAAIGIHRKDVVSIDSAVCQRGAGVVNAGVKETGDGRGMEVRDGESDGQRDGVQRFRSAREWGVHNPLILVSNSLPNIRPGSSNENTAGKGGASNFRRSGKKHKKHHWGILDGEQPQR